MQNKAPDNLLIELPPDLPAGYCTSCHKDVVAHARLGRGQREDGLVWLCLFCDTELVDEGEGPEYLAPGVLKDLGYRLVPPEALDEAPKGCGKGHCGRRGE